jgi:hypothetical protein
VLNSIFRPTLYPISSHVGQQGQGGAVDKRGHEEDLGDNDAGPGRDLLFINNNDKENDLKKQ